MRYRYVVITLSFLLAGCTSLCPMRHLQQDSATMDGSRIPAQPPANGTMGSLPAPSVLPVPGPPASPKP